MDQWHVDQGDSPKFTLSIADSDGNPYTGYAGTESITAYVWPGDEQAPIANVIAADWLSAAAGEITASINGSATTGLVPAAYNVSFVINGNTVAYAELVLGEAPGSGTPRTAHVTLRHLRKFYGKIDKLLTPDDPTALEARADAWDWFCDMLHRHYRGSSGLSTDYQFVPGISFAGAYGMTLLYRDGRRSAELQGWLDAGRLDLTTPVLDAMACYALAQICGGQVDNTEKGAVWQDFADRFAMRAEAIASTITAEIDADGDGVNDTVIRLDVHDTLEG